MHDIKEVVAGEWLHNRRTNSNEVTSVVCSYSGDDLYPLVGGNLKARGEVGRYVQETQTKEER